ncbi:TRAP transporter small permease [Oscillibacter sp.]|uniref:TRAP transporter small permease n=1 Tax=Oscillibacter sp. TaxID=1945593 RepID=UPI00260A28F8|nr:TRAP transporter small permease subunit [Oscillibacter sp.]MDD3347897.1 TRAP transporter small permease subunit [Oscillibacter sp.]
MEKIKSIFDRVETVVTNICALFLSLIIFVIVYQVIARKLDIATSGTEELARYCYVLFVFLLWPIAARRGQDLRITVVFDLFSSRIREIIMGVFQIFMAGFSAVCVYSIFLNVRNAASNGQVLPSNTWIPMAAVYLIIMAALVLTLIANLLRAALLFMGEEHVRTQQEENEAEMIAESAKVAEELKKGGAEV